MKRFVCACIFFLWLQPGSAQSPFFQPYYLLKKNEPLKVNKILQDKTGFIWFGTDKGLFKFDGISYRRFLGIDNLPDESVTALAQDSIGRLWVGFKNGKISVVYKNVITPFEPAEGLPTKQISDILFDKEGVPWFSTHGDGTYYYINNRLYRLDDIDGMPPDRLGVPRRLAVGRRRRPMRPVPDRQHGSRRHPQHEHPRQRPRHPASPGRRGQHRPAERRPAGRPMSIYSLIWGHIPKLAESDRRQGPRTSVLIEIRTEALDFLF